MNGDSPAFPETHIYHWRGQDKEVGETDNVVPRYMGGLTKREYFAAVAMQRLRASRLDAAITDSECGRQIWGSSTIALQAVQDADALIRELSKDQKEKS